MKKTLFSVFALAACVFSAQAQYFTNGNLAVLRIGGPGESVTTSDSGNTVWIDQYTTNGTLVTSLPLPTNGANALIMDGEPYDGLMTLTPDGTHLVIGGFNTSAPYMSNGVPANFALAASTTVPRAIATVDGYGNYSLPIVNSNMFNTFTISGAASDGSNFWAEGGATGTAYGVVYCGTATAPATNEVLTGIFGSGARGLSLYNGNLYAMAYTSNTTTYPLAGGFMVANTGTGALPTNASTATEPFPTGTAAASTPSDLVINPAGTIAYVADYDFGIVKFSNGGSGWVSNYTIVPTNAGYATASGSSHAISVTADFTQTPPVVYATTGETITNRLVMFQDTGAAPTIINLASNLNVTGLGGMTNTFRGVRFVPASVPLIASQPTSLVESADGSAAFTVTASGSPPITYQWYTNGTAVSGATNSSYTVSPVTTFQNGTLVDVAVTSPYGSVTSSNATLTVNPNYFIPGNLAVVSVGGPGQSISVNGDTVSILQYTTTPGQSSPVSVLSLPSTGPTAFTLDNSGTEGFMTLTENGQYLVLGGYNTAVPVAGGEAASTALVAPRAVVTIDGYGNYAMPISDTNVLSASNIRGAVFDGTNNFWVDGPTNNPATNVGGVYYVGTPGSPTATLVGRTGTGNERCLNIYNNTLYVSTGSVNHGIYAITGPNSPPPPIGLPTNAPTQIISMNSSSGPYDFVINPASTICYVAEDNLGGIVKFTYNGSAWVSNYTLSALTSGAAASGTNAEGVTADFTQNPPVIYATTAEAAGNRLISIVDNGAGSTATLLASASSSASGSNYLRGVRFVPGVIPSITAEPQPFTQDAGGDATFSVGATGTPTLEYQWYTNGVAVSGATDSSFTLTSLALAQNGTEVSAVVSNSYGTATSSGALLTVQAPGAPLNVSISPTSQTVNAGSPAVFTASAVGTSLTFIWKLNGVQLSDGGSVSGSSTATLTINPAYASYDGTYTVIASNSFGTAPGNNSATLTVIDPVIITQPVGSTNVPDTSTTLTVTAAGAPTLTYQWVSNGIPLSGATSSPLAIANSGATTAASYYVLITNGLGNSIRSATTVVSFTALLLDETFSYPNGNLFAESPWVDINGTNPELVTNGRVQINQTNNTTDGQRLFSQPVTSGYVWASFVINLSTLPTNANGTYFANIEDTNFGFYAEIYTLTSNAFPGTYRLGIANAAGDYTGTSGGPSAVQPLDMAPGIDYTVVFFYDIAGFSQMSVNPSSESVLYPYPGPAPAYNTSSGPAFDAFTASGLPMAAFGLRQREGEGVMTLDNIEVSYDWSGAGSGYTAVTGGLVPAKPVIGFQPPGTTNYIGNPFVTEVAASGLNLSYQWYQNGQPLSDGDNVTGSATPTLTFGSLVASNAGTYYAIVSNSVAAVPSSNTVIVVSTTPTAPIFTLQPTANTTNSLGTSVTFTSAATGTGPITYQWYFDGTAPANALNDNGSTIVGSQTPTLTLSTLLANESGTYIVVATGASGSTASSNAVLVVTPPVSTSIAYLRSLLTVNPTTDAVTVSDTTTLYDITGTITTFTNLTSGNTASYYIQDSTGGLNLFVTFGSNFRPVFGDVVTATGTLSVYDDNLEIDINQSSPVTAATILTNLSGAPLTNSPPAPYVLPWGFVNANLNYVTTNIEGSVVMLTNVYFETPGVLFVAGTTYVVTNNTGQTYNVYVGTQDTNLNGTIVPAFAWSVTGPLIQIDAPPMGIELTDPSEIITAPPPATSPSAVLTGENNGTNTITLTWTAIPYNYSYSVLEATNLLGPWTPVASGLTFVNANGTYTDTKGTNATEFYLITSP